MVYNKWGPDDKYLTITTIDIDDNPNFFVGPRADKQPGPVSNLLQLSGRICYQTRQKS